MADWLGRSEVLRVGVQRSFEINEGTYDILFRNCDQEPLHQQWNVDVRDGMRIELERPLVDPTRD